MDTNQIRLIANIIEALGNDAPTESTPPPGDSMTGGWVLVRGDRSGVFFGRLCSAHGQTVELCECRHVWFWSGAANVAEMALRGVSDPGGCKFVAPVARLRVLDAIEVVACSDDAVASLSAVPEWSKA